MGEPAFFIPLAVAGVAGGDRSVIGGGIVDGVGRARRTRKVGNGSRERKRWSRIEIRGLDLHALADFHHAVDIRDSRAGVFVHRERPLRRNSGQV